MKACVFAHQGWMEVWLRPRESCCNSHEWAAVFGNVKKEKPDPANMYRAVLISGLELDEYQTAVLITEGTSLHSESYLCLCCHLDNPLQHQSGRSHTDRLTHKHVCADKLCLREIGVVTSHLNHLRLPSRHPALTLAALFHARSDWPLLSASLWQRCELITLS